MLFTLLAMASDLHSIYSFAPAIVDLGANIQIQAGAITHGLVLAQQVPNTDILGNIQGGWNDFLQTGKAGTLAVGLVIGYMVRGMTR